MDSAVDKWEDKDKAAQTMPQFKDHFTKENKRRLKKLALQQAGYHGANAARHKEDTQNTKVKHTVTVNKGSPCNTAGHTA